MTSPKRSGLVALALVGALLTPASASAWNAATHAWLAREQHRGCGQADEGALLTRVYGANALDLFNNDFTEIGQTLQQRLHDPSSDLFLSPWWAAETDGEAAFGFGFASHNNAWGQDSTAHLDGRTNRGHEGWIVWKARLLAPGVAARLAPYGIVLPEPTLQLVSHILVEQAVDFLLVARDPSLPGLLMDSVMMRDGDVPDLLVRAFAADFGPIIGTPQETAHYITWGEFSFRWITAGYANALWQADARLQVAEAIGRQAEDFLGLPPGTGAALVPVIDAAIGDGMALCADDFMRELRATRGWVNGRLMRHGLRP